MIKRCHQDWRPVIWHMYRVSWFAYGRVTGRNRTLGMVHLFTSTRGFRLPSLLHLRVASLKRFEHLPSKNRRLNLIRHYSYMLGIGKIMFKRAVCPFASCRNSWSFHCLCCLPLIYLWIPCATLTRNLLYASFLAIHAMNDWDRKQQVHFSIARAMKSDFSTSKSKTVQFSLEGMYLSHRIVTDAQEHS